MFYCKDSANERHENSLSNGRVQPILYAKISLFGNICKFLGRKNGDYGLIWCVLAYFIIINYRFSVFLLYLWKLNFNNLIMED